MIMVGASGVVGLICSSPTKAQSMRPRRDKVSSSMEGGGLRRNVPSSLDICVDQIIVNCVFRIQNQEAADCRETRTENLILRVPDDTWAADGRDLAGAHGLAGEEEVAGA